MIVLVVQRLEKWDVQPGARFAWKLHDLTWLEQEIAWLADIDTEGYAKDEATARGTANARKSSILTRVDTHEVDR